MMESIKNLIYIICITSVISEVLLYLLPQKSYKNTLKFMFLLVLVISIMLSLNVLKNYDFSSFNVDQQYEINMDDINNIVIDEQVNALKDKIEKEVIEKLDENNIPYIELNTNIILQDTVVSFVECEVYLKEEYKKHSVLLEKISKDMSIEIKIYYIGELNEK